MIGADMLNIFYFFVFCSLHELENYSVQENHQCERKKFSDVVGFLAVMQARIVFVHLCLAYNNRTECRK